MTSPNPTGVLRQEHQRILQVMTVLETHLDRAGALDFDTVEKCVRFFRLFADACHHGKEEDLLFPALEAQGMPRDSGPIAAMLDDHRMGRGLVGRMAASLDAARNGDPASERQLADAGRGYIDLMRAHILKEDHVLFDMADDMVGPAACQRLCAAYDTVCESTFEGCSKAQLEALADEITATP